MIENNNIQYWIKRYQESKFETYDWLEKFENLIEFFEKYIKFDDKILIIGCGNSELSEKLYDNGYKNIINIDYCENIINFMRKRNIVKNRMKWIQMDCLNLKFKDEEFDYAIDKATLDSILLGTSNNFNVSIMANEIQRVLKSEGIFFCISNGKPDDIFKHFKRKHLDFDSVSFVINSERKIIDELTNYFYIFKKRNIIEKDKLKLNYENVKKYLLKDELYKLKGYFKDYEDYNDN